MNGVRPNIMGIGPVPAVNRLLERLGMQPDQFDVIDSNMSSSRLLARARRGDVYGAPSAVDGDGSVHRAERDGPSTKE